MREQIKVNQSTAAERTGFCLDGRQPNVSKTWDADGGMNSLARDTIDAEVAKRVEGICLERQLLVYGVGGLD